MQQRGGLGGSLRRSTTNNTVQNGTVATIPVVTVPIPDLVILQPEGYIIYSSYSETVAISTGTFWKEFPETLTSVTIASVGSGTSIVNDGIGPVFALLSLLGQGISVTSTSTTVTLSNAGVLSIVEGSSPGAGLLASDSTAQNVKIRTVIGVDGILVTDTGSDQTTVAFNPSSSAVTTSITNALPVFGSAVSVLADTTNPDITFKSLASGTNCFLVDNGSYITLTAIPTPPPPNTSLVSVGAGQSIVSDTVGPTLALYGLKAGTGMIVTTAPGGNDVSLTYTAVSGVSSLTAVAPIYADVPTGNVTVSAYPSPGGIGDGFYSYVNAPLLQLVYQPVISNTFWTDIWNVGGMFSGGMVTIQKTGIYAFSWGFCIENAAVAAYLMHNGVTMSGQNVFDSDQSTTIYGIQYADGQATPTGSVTIPCQTGDILYIIVSGNGYILPETRGDSGIGFASYFSGVKLSDWIPTPIPVRPVIPSGNIGVYAYLTDTIFINAYQPIITGTEWAFMFNSNIGFSNGIITVTYPGVYLFSWGMCFQNTDAVVYLLKNGFTICGQNTFDDDGQGLSTGSLPLVCLAGDVIYLIISGNDDIYAETRGDSGIDRASYFSAARIPGT